LKITQWGEYGVHFCAFIAKQHSLGNGAVSAQEIALSQQIAADYAYQILHRLKKYGIIKSVRGPKGGYKLAAPPASITLYSILQAAEGDIFEVLCENKPISSQRCSPGATCGLRPVWYALKEHISDFLKNYTIEHILSDEHPEAAKWVQINERSSYDNPSAPGLGGSK
jgi:Rrf2 family iron-sulfur cluster assembly transcriptional regulator